MREERPLDTTTNFQGALADSEPLETSTQPHDNIEPNGEGRLGDNSARELSMWLSALGSFFNARNLPLTEIESKGILTRDFANETRVAQDALLRCSQLINGLSRRTAASFANDIRDEERAESSLFLEEGHDSISDWTDDALDALAEITGDASALCDALLGARIVSFHAWASLGKIIKRELEQSAATKILAQGQNQGSTQSLQPALLEVIERIEPETIAADVLHIFLRLTGLLETLRFIEASLWRDQPLRRMLPILTFIREETRVLLDFIDARALRIENLEAHVFDALDGMAYAIRMELRKAFEHELVGLSALRQATHLYAKVENAHGLLRDCFQQSIVALAQIFDPTLDGQRLFSAFRTKLDQSLALRGDIWTLLQHVRRAEVEREQRSLAPLIERFLAFQVGSLRFLMYKDWESYERFVEEIGAARGATELAPVLHRFGAYLETLFSQINMRAVLADHPFVSTPLEE